MSDGSDNEQKKPDLARLETILQSKDNKVFKDLSNTKKMRILNTVRESIREMVHVEVSRSFSGPIPPPETLGGYEQVCPGSAERIIKMAEKEQDHAHEMDRMIVANEQKLKNRGQLFAFLITLIAIAGGVAIFLTGNKTAGTVIGGVALVPLVALFAPKFIRLARNKTDHKPE